MVCQIQFKDTSSNVIKLECTIGKNVQHETLKMHWDYDQHGVHMLSLDFSEAARECSAYITKQVDDCEQVGINGYQTWTESGWQLPGSRMYGLRPIFGPINNRYHFKSYGDYSFYDYKTNEDYQHSYHFIEFLSADTLSLFASLDESNGFTVFRYSNSKKHLVIQKELPREISSGDRFTFQFLQTEGPNDACWSRYKSLWKQTAIEIPKRILGWTSWYYHYNNISPSILDKELEAVSNSPLDFKLFQIDDGWQESIGEWVENSNFLNSLSSLVKKTKLKGLKPGLWVAPFIVEEASQIRRLYPEWLQKDENGNPIIAGYNPLWSGKFYVLDFDIKAVQVYLQNQFNTLQEDWGFEFFKLDFLYAACILPKPDETRGQRMFRAMSHLRSWLGNNQILACGIPLASASGLADYCRVSADIGPEWESFVLKTLLRYKERISTESSIYTSLYRSKLNGLYFGNDPDVFVMRNDKTKLSKGQKLKLLKANLSSGALHMTSDPVDKYDKEVIQDIIENINAS